MQHILDVAPGVSLYYTVDDFTDPWTPAKTVILVHGFAESGEAWRGWVPHLSRDYRVVRLDQRGFGRSTAMARDFAWSLDILSGDLVRLIETVTPTARRPVHVVAAKIAGPVAIRTATARPDLVATLTLVGTPVVGPNGAGWIEHIDTKGVRDWAETTMDARMGSAMPAEAKRWWIELTARTQASTMLGFLAAAPAIDVRAELTRLACPCLVFTSDTRRHPLTEVQAWQRTIRHSELSVVPGDAYHSAAAMPDHCAAVTRAFLRRHDQS